MRTPGMLVVLGLLLAAAPSRPGDDVLYLDTLDLAGISQDWGKPGARKSVDGNPLRIGGRAFERGVGTHATSEFVIDLKGVATRLEAWVGVDAEVGESPASVVFEVYVDGARKFQSGVMRPHDEARRVEVDLVDRNLLELVVTEAGDTIDYDHADWADARLHLTPGASERPTAYVPKPRPAEVLTPPPPPEPRIVGPRTYGARPGSPFLFRIPATGAEPLAFEAVGLPDGLTLDPATGIITGAAEQPGTYQVGITARNEHGEAARDLMIQIGPQICLTPPLGWNSWNVWGTSVDDAKVRAAAKAMVDSGLARHGWTYINIDDAWEGKRAEDGTITTNEKFPDMKALADYVHSLGLKLGIYSSPGPKTCAGYEGSLGHEKRDAETYAAWGIDYLKYDWCSCESEDPKAPYALMRRNLEASGRDIVYSLCQYGRAEVWTWGASVGGNCWRTTGDITDTWGSMSGIGFRQAPLAPHAGPGHWNDPDMLVVGKLGWGPKIRPTQLTPDEQYTHISLWALLASPLLLGCDLTQLDDFTLGLLTNDEVLAVSQDPIGRQARRVKMEGRTEVWARPLVDGTVAVGLFNRSVLPRKVTARFADVGLAPQGPAPVRDLWRQKDLGGFETAFDAEVPPHGVVLVKIGRPAP